MTNSKQLQEDFKTLVDYLRNRNADEAKCFVDERPQLLTYVDDSGRLALHWACSCGTLPFVQMILASNADGLINREDDIGWTLLMIAASAGHLSVVKYLLSFAQCDVNRRNKNGQTALHYACSKDHVMIARMLIDNGAELNAADRYGSTPLHRAAAQGRENVVHMLLAAPGICIDATDREGSTPLHCAVEDQHEAIALYLVERGANIMLTNKEGRTPIDAAQTTEFKRQLRAAVAACRDF